MMETKDEKELLSEKEIKNYMYKIVGSRKCEILNHYITQSTDIIGGTEVIRVRPEYSSFNIHPNFLKYIDNLSTDCVDISISANLRIIIQLNNNG